MRTAKRTGIAALFAVFFALLLAGCLCLGLPAKREAQAAEGAVSEEGITITVDNAINFLAQMADPDNNGNTIQLGAAITIDLTDETFVSTVYPSNPGPNKDLVLKAADGASLALTVDLNGYKLEIITGSTKSCLTLIGDVSLTVIDSSESGSGQIVGHSNGNMFLGEAESSLVLENVDVEFSDVSDKGITVSKPAISTEGSVSLDNVTYKPEADSAPLVDETQGEVVYVVDSADELRSRLGASGEGATVTLLADTDATVVYEGSSDITLELNGHKLGGAFTWKPSKQRTLDIYGGTATSEGNGTFAAALNVEKSSRVNFRSGTFEGKITSNGGNLYFYGGTFTGAIEKTLVEGVAQGVVYIYGGEFSSTFTVAAGTFYIYSGTFESDAAFTGDKTPSVSIAKDHDPPKFANTISESSFKLDTTKYERVASTDGYYTIREIMYFEVNDEQFQSFEDALNAAGENGTIKLLRDIEGSSRYTIDKSITLDLGGYTVTSSNPSGAFNVGKYGEEIKVTITNGAIVATANTSDKGGYGAIDVSNKATLTLQGVSVTGVYFGVRVGTPDKASSSGVGHLIVKKNTTIANAEAAVTPEDNAETRFAAIGVYGRGGSAAEYVSTVTVEGGKVVGYYYGIVNNGTDDISNTKITITGGAVENTLTDDGAAIFNPGKGEVTVSGGSITGATGIEMRAGSLIVSGEATITATGTYKETATDSGSSICGAAVALSPHVTNNQIEFDIQNGSFSGEKAFVQKTTNEAYTPSVSGTITDGKFDGDVEAESNVLQNFISNGTFSEELPVEYLDEGMAQLVETDSDGNVSVTVGKAEDISASENAVAMLNGTTVYTSLQAAITAAGEGATVTLLKNVSESVTIEKGKNITLDLGDNTLEGSAGDKWTIWNKGTLTVKNGKVIGNTSAIFNGVNSEDEDVSTQMSDATLTLEKVTLEAKVTAAVTLNNSSAKIVSITDSTITAPTGATALQNSGAITSITDTTIKAESGLFKGKAIVLSGNVDLEGSGVIEKLTGGSITGEIRVAANASGQAGSIVIENCTVTDATFVCGDDFYVIATENGYTAGAQDMVMEAGAVAAIGNVAYASLQDAIDAAKDGDTVKLLADVDTASTITIDKSLTLDLNGKKITAVSGATITISGGKTAETSIAVNIKNGYINSTAGDGVLIGNAAMVNMSNVEVVGYNYGIMLNKMMNQVPAGTYVQPTTLTMEGGKAVGTNWAGVAVCGINNDGGEATKFTATGVVLTGGWYGVAGHGTSHNTYIALTDCTITGTKGDPEGTTEAAYEGMGLGIYHPQKGELIIDGGTITGVASGIEMRSGSLTVKGDAKITALSKTANMTPNGSGSTAAGMAIAVSQHTTNNPISVTLENGTFTGVYALFERDIQDPSTGTVAMKVTGGTFNGDIASENVENFISGKGVKFSKMPKMDYFAANYIAEYNEVTGKYETKEGSWVAAIGEEGYATLQDAINAAENGDTIILRADIGSAETPATAEEIVVDKAGAEITLDLKGKSIYVTNGYNDVNNGLKFINLKAGTLNVINSEEGGGVISASGRAFQIVPEERVEAKLVLGKGVKVHAVGGPAVFIMPDGAANVSDGSAYYAVLESAADLSTDSTYGAIQGNGTAHGTFITINGGTLSSQGNVIYHPQYGKLVINGGTFESPIAGVEVRAGELIVNGGKFNIGGTFKCEYNGNGATIEGAAIAVSQHTTDLPLEFTIAGGTFNSGADGKAFYQAATISENTAPVTGEIKGGEFNGEVGAATLTGFIEGGDFGVKPADKLMNENYAAEYVNGRYVAVPSTALQEARLAAQADVRAYAAAKGIDWSQIEAAAADESAVKVLATYNAIAEAMSTLAVAEAKDAAFDAVDDYDAAAAAALAETKQGYIDDLKKLAAGDEATDEDDIILPTATYFAINSAATAEEALFYYKNAKAEIADIRAYRGEIAAQAEKLEALKGAIAAIDDSLFGTDEGAQGAIEAIQDAIKAAQEAITNGDETTSTSLKQIYDYLNGTLKSAVDDISNMLNGAVSEGGILYEMQETLEALNSTVNGALLEKLNTAITNAQEAINGNTATEMGEAVKKITEAITAAREVIIAALPDYEETLGEIAGSVEALEELLGGTNGLAAIKKGIDDALAAIGTADGETLFEQLAAIESGNTAIKTTVDGLAAALTGKDGAIATLTAALTAMQGDITELTGALAEDTGWVAKDIAAAQAEIDKLTAAVGKLGTVDGKDLAAVVGEIADGLEEMDATVNSIASTVSAASAVEEAKTQAAADIRTWLEGYLEELAGDTAQADVLARAAYTAETTEGELYKDISAQFGEENGKLVLKYYNEALAAIDAATTVSDVTTAVATFRAQVASIEASAGNSTDLTVVYVLLGVVLLVLIIACIVALVKGGRKPEPAPAQAAPAEKPAEAQPEEKAEEKEEQAEEAAPAEEPAGETAPAEEESAAAEDDDKERVVISANVRTFDEAYEDLTDEQRELFNKVKEYALAKEDAVEVKQSGGVVIKRKSKQIVKLTVRRDMPVALFLLENEMLKDFRRNAKSEAKLKVRATELVIREADDLETAYTMVDLSVEQIEKDLEAAKERRREARRQRRLQRQAEEAAAEQAEEAEEPAPADEPASAESAATDGTDTE